MAASFLEDARKRVAAGQTSNQLNASSKQTQPNFLEQARNRVATGQTANQIRTEQFTKEANQNKKAAMKATLSDTRSGNGPQTLMQKATGGVYDNTARKVDRATNRRVALENDIAKRMQTESAEESPELYSDQRRLKALRNQEQALKGQREQERAAEWEEMQRSGIEATGNAELLQELQRLNDLEALVKGNQIMTAMTGGMAPITQTEKDYLELQKKLSDQYGDELGAWKEYAARQANKERMGKAEQELADAAKERPGMMSAATIPVNMASGLGYLDVLVQRATNAVTGKDTPIDYNRATMLPSKATNAIRGSVSEKIEQDTEGKIGSDTAIGNLYSGLYNLGMSMGDSAVGMATGNGILLAGAAATNAMNEAVSRGATTDQALMVGLATGAMEGVMEKLSIDSLFNMTEANTLKQLVLNVLKQGGVEATEEVATTIANTIADALIMGDKSQLNTAREQYIQMGYSPKEAEKMALKDWGIGLATDAIDGFISGGAFESAKGSVEYIGNRSAKAPLRQASPATSPQGEAVTPVDAAIQQTLNENRAAPAAQAEQTAEPVQTVKGTPVSAKPVERAADVGDIGAKTSDFPREVKESQGNTTPEYYETHNIPEEGRADNHYTTRTWEEARHNAQLRLDQDYDGEVEYLKSKPTWTDEEMAEGDMILNQLREAAEESGDWTEHQKWAKVFNAHKEEAGRALAYLASLKKGTGDSVVANASAALENAKSGTDVNEIMQTVDTYAKELDDAVKAKSVDDLLRIIRETAVERKTKKKWGRLLGGEIDWALKRVAEYAKADNADSFDFLQNFAAAGIEAIAEDAKKTSLGNQVKTVRRNAMLSKVSTIMRNLVGNGAFDGIDTLARNVSVPLDMLLSKFTGTRSVAYDRGALSKEGRQGMLDGLAKALLEVGLDVNAEGAKSKYENSSSRTFKMAQNKVPVVPQLFSTWEKYMGYALNVTDEAAKGSVEARVQRGLDKLYEQGKIKEDDDSLRNGGAQEALYRTFQDDSALAQMSVGMRNALNKVHVGDVGLGDVTMPFAQVPANLADRAIDYSPAGLAKSAYGLADVLVKAKKGTLTAAEQAKAVQTLGRNITGSTLIAIAAAAAMKGLIHVENPGGEDENKDLAAHKKMQGLTGTQFNVSGLMRWANGESTELENEDVLMSIAFLEPFNAHLAIGALLAEDLEEEGELTAKTVGKDTLTGALTAIMDLPMFSAFGDAYDAYQYSDKEREGEKLADAANTLLANEASSIIPNAWKGIAQGLDPYQRDLYSKEGAWGQTADQFRAVFDRDSLPIKQDPYGRDMTNEGGVLNFLNTNILPGQITKYRETDLDKAIMDTYERTGSAAVFASRKAPDEITVDGEKVALAPEQQRRYQEIYGQAEQGTREALYSNRLYDNLDPKLEQKAHEIAEDYAKQTAKAGMLVGFEADDWVKDLKGKSPAEIAEVVIQKTMETAAENKKLYKNKYVGISGLLDDGTIDDKVALAIMSDSAVDGYMDYCKKAGVSVSDYADALAYMKKTDDKEKTLKYIEKMNLSKAKKIALAQGIYGANPTYIPKEEGVNKYWLAEIGAIDELAEQFGEDRKADFDTYIRDSGVDIQVYLDLWDFKEKQTNTKDENGKTTYPAYKKVIDKIDTMKLSNKEKRTYFLGIGYSEKNIPSWWK